MLQSSQIGIGPVASGHVASPTLEVERTRVKILPINFRIANDDADISGSVRVRHVASARQLTTPARKLPQPEKFDFEDNMFGLLEESKLDGAAKRPPVGALMRRCSIRVAVGRPSPFDTTARFVWRLPRLPC